MVNNFYERFAASAERFSARAAVEVQRRDRVDVLTYRDLRQLADQAAAALLSTGLAAGDRCVLLAENDAHWLAAYLGVLRLGAVAVPFDTAYKPKQIAALLRDCGARVVLTTARHLQAAAEGAEACGARCEIILLDNAPPGRASLFGRGGGTGAALPPCPATARDPAVILYTSGTTSDPKGVVLTHGNLLAEVDAALAVISVTERDCILGVLPLFHALAQVANLMAPLTVGARVLFLESVNTNELLRALSERDVTAFCCVPQFFYLIHQRVEREVAAAGWLRLRLFRFLLVANGGLRRVGLNLGPYLFGRIHQALGRRMRLLVTGGSRFDPAVGRDLYCMGFDLLQAYGLTECCGGATLTRPGDRWDGSVGRSLPGVEVKVLPPESQADGETGDGEVAIRGPIVMQGYYNRPETNAVVLRDGWLHTGDLGVLDERGRLHITGRKKEVIVLSSGKNIYPEEIEAHYLQSPYVKEMCVLGLARLGEPVAERLHAVVVPDFDVLREQKIVNAREIIRFELETLSVQLPGHKRILSFDIWQEELPRTTTRKLKRFEIERRVRAQSAATEEAATAPPVLGEEEAAWAATPEVAQALAVIAEMAKVQGPVRPEANIELDLGLDSMERVELLTHLEKLFGTAVSDEAASRIYTVRDLVEAVRSGERRGPTTEAGGEQAWERLLQEAPEDDPVFTDLLRPRPLTALLLFGVIKMCYLAGRVLFRFRVSGREYLPTSGPFLLCPNHQSYLDPFLLASALPYRVMRQLFFVGASEFFATPLMRWLARRVNLVPVDPDSNLVRAMQAGAFGLRHGKVLVLFPEGERSIDGRIKKFKKGASILSAHMRVPIVPVAFEGLFEVWPRGRSVQGLSRVGMCFGAPIPPPPAPAPASSLSETEAAYARATEELRSRVEQLWETLREAGAAEQAVVS